MPKMVRSWIAVYRYVGPKGGNLIGGKLEGRSSRWGEKEDAQLSLDTTIEINGGSSRCAGEVIPSYQYPEIFRHCPGHPAQAIGGRCFGCGKTLTVADAKKHRSVS